MDPLPSLETELNLRISTLIFLSSCVYILYLNILEGKSILFILRHRAQTSAASPVGDCTDIIARAAQLARGLCEDILRTRVIKHNFLLLSVPNRCHSPISLFAVSSQPSQGLPLKILRVCNAILRTPRRGRSHPQAALALQKLPVCQALCSTLTGRYDLFLSSL